MIKKEVENHILKDNDGDTIMFTECESTRSVNITIISTITTGGDTQELTARYPIKNIDNLQKWLNRVKRKYK
ncbi:MAG: hypothetical protein WC390_07210 [Sulfurimonas sp.]